MARKNSGRRPKRSINSKLLEVGISASALSGFALLFVQPTLSRSPLMRPLGQVVSSIAWPALMLGLVLVGLSLFLRQRNNAATNSPRLTPEPVEPRFDVKSPTTAAVSPSGRDRATAPRPAETQAPGKPTSWSSQVFRDIEWRRFEAVCEALFAQAGFEARTQSHGADGGVDIWLYSRNAEGPVAIVQCKHWSGKQVGVREMREFFGVMASHKLPRGTYATTSTYSDDAKKFAKENGISALDGDALLALILKRTPEQQVALLAVAYEGDYSRPTCASCGTKMVERRASKKGSDFWGCANFPKCRSTLPMRT